MTTRAVCYCKDCQAFARYLGREDDVLDAHAGTSIVATLPKQIRFTEGMPQLACMSLSNRGLLRWYAKCCHTPIGNTPRDVKFPYVGLVAACLPGATPAQSFGPIRLVVNTDAARGTVASKSLGNIAPMLAVMASVFATRLNGSYRRTPFFTATGAPVVEPIVLSAAERARVTPAD